MSKKAKTVWVIMVNHEHSDGCSVNAVCLNKEYAMAWIKRENKKLGIEAYYLERSQLLYNREVKE